MATHKEARGGSYHPPEPTIPAHDRGLSVSNAAALLGVSAWTLYAWVRERRVPHYKMGTKLRFSRRELEDWLGKHKVAPVA